MKNAIWRNHLSGCLLAAAVLSASGAQAACTQADLTGTWYSMGVSGDLYYGSMDEIDRCKIVIGSTGAIVASASSCIMKDTFGQYTVGISSGSFKVTSTCAVSGSMRLCYSGICITGRVPYAQLARDKNILPMLGISASDPDVIFSYTAVKR